MPESRCTATILNFDITDALVGPVQEALQAEAQDAARRIREITNVRDRVAAIWASLNQPIAVGTNLWFAFNFSNAVVRPPQITPDGRYISIRVALEGAPKVIFGARPPVPATPLPVLSIGDASPQFDLRVRGLVTYAKASTVLADHLRGPAGPSSLWGSRITGASVSGRGRDIIASLDVGGLLAGTYYLFGVPQFEPRSDGLPGGILRLKTARFTIETTSPLTRLAVSLFRTKIEHTLEEAAWWDVSAELQAAASQFGNALNRDLTPQATLAGRLSRFGPGAVRVGLEGVEAWYELGGKVEVVVNPFN